MGLAQKKAPFHGALLAGVSIALVACHSDVVELLDPLGAAGLQALIKEVRARTSPDDGVPRIIADLRAGDLSRLEDPNTDLADVVGPGVASVDIDTSGPVITASGLEQAVSGGTARVTLTAVPGPGSEFNFVFVTVGGSPEIEELGGFYVVRIDGDPTDEDLDPVTEVELFVTIPDDVAFDDFLCTYQAGILVIPAGEDEGPLLIGDPVETPVEIRRVVTGTLQVSLTWSSGSNLDLCVFDPLGREIKLEGVNSTLGVAAAGTPGADCAASGTELFFETLTWGSDGTPEPLTGDYTTIVRNVDDCGGPGDFILTVLNLGRVQQVFSGRLALGESVSGPFQFPFQAELALTKTVDDATPDELGRVEYEITVTNEASSPNTATGVQVTDDLPAGLVSDSVEVVSVSKGSFEVVPDTDVPEDGVDNVEWDVGNLAIGASATMTISAEVEFGTANERITNTVSAVSDQAELSLAEAAVDVFDNGFIDLSITKMVDGLASVTRNELDPVVYTIVATNSSDGGTAADVRVADILPPGISFVSATPTQGSFDAGTWTVGQLLSGASAQLLLTARVDAGTSGQTITNTALVSGATTDPFSDNDTASASVDVNQPPLAAAGADQTVTDEDFDGGESVTLDGAGSSDPDGTVTAYAWSEGGTTIATGVNPTVILPVGNHTIVLTVTDDDGGTGNDLVRVTVLEGNGPPIADAGPDQTLADDDGTGAEPTTLDGSGSLDGDGTIASYVWKDGVVTIGTGVNPTVNLAVGVHTITLTVTDDDGGTGTDQVTVTVVANQPPTAEAGPDQTVRDLDLSGSEPVTLTAVGSFDPDGNIASFAWTEGATTISNQPNPTVDLSVGTHLLTLTVTDNGGATGFDVVTIIVQQGNLPPVANAGANQTLGDDDATNAELATLNGAASSDSDGTITSFVWTEGASTIANGVNPTVNLAVGVHNITLTVTDNEGGTDTDVVVITVAANQPPVANAGPNQTLTDTDLSGSELVTLNGLGSTDPDGTIVSGVWTEGATQIATGTNPTVDLPLGVHDITLTITDNGGATDTDVVRITVQLGNQPPVANAGANQTLGDDDGTGAEFVMLDGSGSTDPDGTISSYVWTEGATTIANGIAPIVNLAVGVHNITLTVTDDGGDSDADQVVVTVVANQSPTAAAGANQVVTDTDLSGSEPVTLDSAGSFDPDGNIVSGVWTEGATTLSTEPNPTVSLSVGVHVITLTVTDNGGATDTDTVQITVQQGNQPPVADAGPNQTVNDDDATNAELVTLNGSGSSDPDGTITSHVWREAATIIANGVSPTVNLGVGVHNVTLTVTDDGGDTDTDAVVITVVANQSPSADAGPDQIVTDADLSGSEPVMLTSNGSSDPDGAIVSGVWTEGATILSTEANPTVNLSVGVHIITLTVTDNGGATDTDTVRITVQQGNQAPIANAGPDQTVSDANATNTEFVTLDGGGSSDPDGTIASYVWTEGATTIGNGVGPIVNLAVGVHDITLTVTDDGGDTGTDQVRITVAANQSPTASAGPNQTVTDDDLSGAEDVILNGAGSSDPDGTITSYVWREGATLLATGVSPSVNFALGTHTVTLTVTDNGGATDMATVQITIQQGNEPPVANAGGDQTVNDDDGTGAEPVTLNGSASSDPDGTIASYVWTEGATTVGTGVSPTPNLGVGVHNITLTVTDDGGKTDTDQVVITVVANQSPTAVSGPNQSVTDDDLSGSELVTLNGAGSSDPDGTIASYVWREGATQIATGVSPSVAFAVGVHNVTLTVTDNGGATDMAAVVITVEAGNQPPMASAGGNQSVNDDDGTGAEPVTLNGGASTDPDGTIVSYEWFEGAMLIATGVSPGVNLTVGVHTITLTVTDDGGKTDSAQVMVTVVANQTPTANAGPDQMVTDTDLSGDEVVTLNAGGSSDPDGTLTTYVWMDGAAQIATGVNPMVTLGVGVHNITLTVTDNGGAMNADAMTVTVNAGNQSPTANAGLDQTLGDDNGTGDELVTLNGAGSMDPDGMILSYVWTEGATTLAMGVNPMVTLGVGVHNVTLTVTDDQGAMGMDQVVVTVVANVPPTADAGSDVTVTDFDVSGDEPVTLNGSASTDTDGTIVSYEWFDGASLIASGVNPTVNLPLGLYTITLIVTDNGGAADSSDVFVIVNDPPLADAGLDDAYSDHDGTGAELVTLDGTSSIDFDGIITSYVWMEGVMQIATGANPSVSLGVGVHNITLTVTDDDGATDSDQVSITVEANLPPTAAAGPDQMVPDVDMSGAEDVTLDGSGSSDPDGSIASYVWMEGATQIATGVNPTVSLPVGAHTITLIVTDDGSAMAMDDVLVTVF